MRHAGPIVPDSFDFRSDPSFTLFQRLYTLSEHLQLCCCGSGLRGPALAIGNLQRLDMILEVGEARHERHLILDHSVGQFPALTVSFRFISIRLGKEG